LGSSPWVSKIMKKKIIVLVVFFVIAAAIGGVFYWWENIRLTPPEKWDTAKFNQSKDFIVTDTPNGKLVEDKKEKIKFLLPTDWTKASEDNIGGIIFLGPDSAMAANFIVSKGCKVFAMATEAKTDMQTLGQALRQRFSWSSIENLQFTTTTIANHKAIRNSFDETKMKYAVNAVHIPTSRAIYDIVLETTEQDKTQCETVFENALKTLVIK